MRRDTFHQVVYGDHSGKMSCSVWEPIFLRLQSGSESEAAPTSDVGGVFGTLAVVGQIGLLIGYRRRPCSPESTPTSPKLHFLHYGNTGWSRRFWSRQPAKVGQDEGFGVYAAQSFASSAADDKRGCPGPQTRSRQIAQSLKCCKLYLPAEEHKSVHTLEQLEGSERAGQFLRARPSESAGIRTVDQHARPELPQHSEAIQLL
ncbi:hypothetical protein BC835DRAFT_513242 [Cytidiella melzeri]|nr:hypothetical protein BC835DRAFT_513242 [Cytidiella melzeri]